MNKIDTSKLITAESKFNDLRTQKIAQLDQMCAADITADFIHDALGTPHTYPSKPTDQANLSASVMDSLLPNPAEGWCTKFWCADEEGTWEMREHSAEQIQAVGTYNKARILSHMQRNAALAHQALAIPYGPNAKSDLEAIVW